MNIRLNGVKYDRSVLRKIVKIPVIRCLILRLKCTKFDFHKGFAQDSGWCGDRREGIKSFPDPVAVFG